MAKSLHSLNKSVDISKKLEWDFAISLPDANNPSTNDLHFAHRILKYSDRNLEILKVHRTLSDSILLSGVTLQTGGQPLHDCKNTYGLPCSGKPSISCTTSSSFSSVAASTSDSSDSSYRLPISASQLSLPEPPDGGWGWVVVFAAFMVHMITDGVIVSFGVFIEDLVNEFKESMSATSWIGSFSYGVPALVAPIASIFLNRFGCRVTCMLGGIISALGCLAGAFTNSVLHLVFTFGILSGLGASFAITSALVIVSMYFDDRRATATGLSIAGTGVGALIFAPIVERLLVIYTWRGTFVLMAGAFLNLVVCGALMRPVETRLERRHRQRLAWLEHLVKESGITPIINKDSYMDLDVLGRIKLLRDELLAPRYGHQKVGKSKDLLQLSHSSCLKESEDSSITLQPYLNHQTGGSLFRSSFSGARSESHSVYSSASKHPKVHKLNLVAIPEGDWTEIKCLEELSGSEHPRCLSTNECGEVTLSRVNNHCYDNDLNTILGFSSVDNYIHNILGSQKNSVHTHSLPTSFSELCSRDHTEWNPSYFQPTSIAQNLVSDVSNHIAGKPVENHASHAHPKVIISDNITFDRPCDRVDIFYRYSLNSVSHIRRYVGLSLPDLHETSRIKRGFNDTGSDSSSDSEYLQCCPCMISKPDNSTNQIGPLHPCLLRFQHVFSSCEVPFSENTGRRLFKRMCDVRLFSKPSFAFFVLSNFLLYFWYNVTYFFMVVHAKALGMSETTAALLFSVMGGANMVGEVIVGLLADREWVDALTLYLIMLLACGLSTSIVPWLTNFILLSFYAGVFGFGLAANDALCTILLVEFVGLERLTNGLGICFFCQGVANIVGPPVIGYIIDSASSVNPAFIISGIGMILAGLSVVPVIVQRCRRRRARFKRRQMLAKRHKLPEAM